LCSKSNSVATHVTSGGIGLDCFGLMQPRHRTHGASVRRRRRWGSPSSSTWKIYTRLATRC